MFPSRVDIERKMIARTWQTRWAAFQLVRERERERRGNTSWLFQSCEFTTVTIKRGGLLPVEHTWTRDCVSLFTRKASFLHSTGSSCGDDVFQPVSTELVHCHNLLSRLRIVTLLPPSLSHPFQPSAQLPRKFSTGFMHSTYLVQSSIVPRIIFFTFPSWHGSLSRVYVSIVAWGRDRAWNTELIKVLVSFMNKIISHDT